MVRCNKRLVIKWTGFESTCFPPPIKRVVHVFVVIRTDRAYSSDVTPTTISIGRTRDAYIPAGRFPRRPAYLFRRETRLYLNAAYVFLLYFETVKIDRYFVSKFRLREKVITYGNVRVEILKYRFRKRTNISLFTNNH